MHEHDCLHALRAVLPTLTKAEIADLLSELSNDEAEVLLYDWPLWARSEQLPPLGDWYIWLILAGRGWGKTRTGAEFIRWRVETGQARRIGLIGQTVADVRDVIVEGESGLLAVCPPWNRPTYEQSKRRLTWPNGAIATTYSGDSPDQLRGPQHDTIWCDELAKWRYAQECWDNMEMGLRLGDDPRAVVTTTPRPIPLIVSLRDDLQTVRPTTNLSTHINRVNVNARFVARVINKYAGTRLGRQELDAEILDDTPGALWTRSGIEATRITARDLPALIRVVVGVDVSVGGEDGETGIIGCGRDAGNHGYVLADYTSSGDPAEWAPEVIRAYIELRADKIVAEKNQGGTMIEHVIRQTSIEINGVTIRGANLPIELVWASRGKHTRAEPISILWAPKEQRGHFVGALPELEDQCCTWVPGEDSPDRMDAQVWAMTDLFPNEEIVETTAPMVGGQRGLLAAGPGLGRRGRRQ
jgi:phage terminase large subunit-like protein